MEFDKSKVYTVLNANEVKVGSKGYFADNLRALKDAVCTADKSVFGEIALISIESCYRRFNIKDEVDYALFYLVEEPEESRFRPYKDTDEMTEDFIQQFDLIIHKSRLPIIWVKSKSFDDKYLVVFLSSNNVSIVNQQRIINICMSELYSNYTYLDGSPCGIEEQAYDEDA